MKPVKAMPRFRCDFCNRVSTERAMRDHERRCFFNPERHCDYCKDTGFMSDPYDFGARTIGCRYCEKCDVVRQSVWEAMKEEGHLSETHRKWLERLDIDGEIILTDSDPLQEEADKARGYEQNQALYEHNASK